MATMRLFRVLLLIQAAVASGYKPRGRSIDQIHAWIHSPYRLSEDSADSEPLKVALKSELAPQNQLPQLN